MTSRMTVAAISLTALITACGGGATSQPTSGTPADTAAPSTTVVADPASGRLSANTASQAELVTALTAAGVDNADRWAREIQEYRPYDSSDADLTKLRQELAKYNPAAGVVDAIVSVLQP